MGTAASMMLVWLAVILPPARCLAMTQNSILSGLLSRIKSRLQARFQLA
jgi:hypothetical protein